ncbi:MAG: ATP-binding protein [Oligoflexia bacterium]|nr:ATP-binding protein [Oligoflexia bacterium]
MDKVFHAIELEHLSIGMMMGMGLFAGLYPWAARRHLRRSTHKTLEELPIAAIQRIGDRLILNSAAERLTGFEARELETSSEFFNHLFGLKAAETRALYDAYREHDFPGRITLTLTRKNGEARIVELIASRGRDVEIWLLFNITERIRAEERFRVLFENSQDGYLLFDQETLIDCNPAAATLMGLSGKEELLSCNFDRHSPEFQPDGTRSAEKSLLMTEEAQRKGFHRFEWLHRKLDGTEFPVEVTLISVKIASKPALIAIWHDLTEQRFAQTQLLQSSKMASLGEMASGLAHEINNPLSIIRTRAEALEMLFENGTPTLAELQRFTQGISATVDRIAKIVQGLRNIARDSSREPRVPTELRRLFEETLSFCEARFRQHGIALEVCLPEPELLLECQPVQISQVLLNLLNNALDAVQELPVRWVRVETRKIDNELHIAVTDSGQGIPPEILKHLMQPYFSTKSFGKGTGLGLSISRNILRAHQGSLEIDSTCPNTRFVIRLPLRQASSVPKHTQAA